MAYLIRTYLLVNSFTCLLVYSFISKLQLFFFFYRHLTLVEFRGIETEGLDEEIINGIALVRTEVMTLIRQMDIAYILLLAIESIDALQIGIFQFGSGRGPVAAIAYEHHRFRSEHGCYFRITRAAASELYRHAALAGTAAIKPRREAHHRIGSRIAVVESCEKYGLCAASRTTVHSHSRLVYILAVYHPVEDAYAVEGLHLMSLGCLMGLCPHFIF